MPSRHFGAIQAQSPTDTIDCSVVKGDSCWHLSPTPEAVRLAWEDMHACLDAFYHRMSLTEDFPDACQGSTHPSFSSRFAKMRPSSRRGSMPATRMLVRGQHFSNSSGVKAGFSNGSSGRGDAMRSLNIFNRGSGATGASRHCALDALSGDAKRSKGKFSL